MYTYNDYDVETNIRYNSEDDTYTVEIHVEKITKRKNGKLYKIYTKNDIITDEHFKDGLDNSYILYSKETDDLLKLLHNIKETGQAVLKTVTYRYIKKKNGNVYKKIVAIDKYNRSISMDYIEHVCCNIL